MKLNEHYILKEIAGEFMLVYQDETNVDVSKVITVNEVGALIIKGAEANKSEEEIIESILKEYDIDEETVRKDVKEYIAKLKELKIVHD